MFRFQSKILDLASINKIKKAHEGLYILHMLFDCMMTFL